MARTPWYRLDNVGKYYSSQAGRAGQTVFRFAATFVDSISPEALQRASTEASHSSLVST